MDIVEPVSQTLRASNLLYSGHPIQTLVCNYGAITKFPLDILKTGILWFRYYVSRFLCKTKNEMLTNKFNAVNFCRSYWKSKENIMEILNKKHFFQKLAKKKKFFLNPKWISSYVDLSSRNYNVGPHLLPLIILR